MGMLVGRGEVKMRKDSTVIDDPIICVCVCVCVCIYIYIYMYICMYICMYIYICVCVCVYIYMMVKKVQKDSSVIAQHSPQIA